MLSVFSPGRRDITPISRHLPQEKPMLPPKGKMWSKRDEPRNSAVEVDRLDVHAASLSTEYRSKTSQTSLGFCVDIGAPRSVIGRKELTRMYNAHGIHNRHTHPSNNRSRFADAIFESLGKIHIPLKTPPGAPRVNVGLDIVSARYSSPPWCSSMITPFWRRSTVARMASFRGSTRSLVYTCKLE